MAYTPKEHLLAQLWDGGFLIDKLKLWEATTSLADGVSRDRSGLHTEPLWCPGGFLACGACAAVDGIACYPAGKQLLCQVFVD